MSVTKRGGVELGGMPQDDFIALLQEEIASKTC